MLSRAFGSLRPTSSLYGSISSSASPAPFASFTRATSAAAEAPAGTDAPATTTTTKPRKYVKKKVNAPKKLWPRMRLAPPDPIFGLTEAFQRDKNPKKVNLGVGAYRDQDNQPFLLPSVETAEKELLGTNHEYSSIEGSPKFLAVSAGLLFGTDSVPLNEDRIASLQTLSGTGALRVAGEMLYRFNRDREIFLPDPTWGNHHQIFSESGLAIKTYPYEDGRAQFDFEAMKIQIEVAPRHSVFLLHACAHNPTGIDPTPDQWKELSALFKKCKHTIIMDCAYQGFASGVPHEDNHALKQFVQDGHELIVCQSFAKNMGLYGERIGAIHIVVESPKKRLEMVSQLKALVRPMYSNPPIHGAKIVSKILLSKHLTTMWEKDVLQMATRIKKSREALKRELYLAGSTLDWDHMTDQIGMFCYSGLTPEQCDVLRTAYSVYLTRNGRISMAGISGSNVKYVAECIHKISKGSVDVKKKPKKEHQYFK